MLLKFQSIFLLSAIVIANAELCDDLHMNILTQIEGVRKTLDILTLKVESSDKFSDSKANFKEMEEIEEKSRKIKRPVFDIRIDSFPEHCKTDKLPSNCAEATECTHRSGYYNITVARHSNQTFLAFCDYNFEEGDWLYILRRVDGSENFRRPWSDYVKGFGAVDREYWIGLENLYALTNYDGPQELYVYIENFEGETRYAKYNHFVIGNASEGYALKSLDKYSGTAGDSFEKSIGSKFSTYDNAEINKDCFVGSGSKSWWGCFQANPTGGYFRGKYSNDVSYYNGAYWHGFNGFEYSHKTFIFMIRRQRSSME